MQNEYSIIFIIGAKPLTYDRCITNTFIQNLLNDNNNYQLVEYDVLNDCDEEPCMN